MACVHGVFIVVVAAVVVVVVVVVITKRPAIIFLEVSDCACSVFGFYNLAYFGNVVKFRRVLLF